MWTTEEIFSTDGILFQRPRRRAGEATWSSICCIAPPASPRECRADRGDPERRKEQDIRTREVKQGGDSAIRETKQRVGRAILDVLAGRHLYGEPSSKTDRFISCSRSAITSSIVFLLIEHFLRLFQKPSDTAKQESRARLPEKMVAKWGANHSVENSVKDAARDLVKPRLTGKYHR